MANLFKRVFGIAKKEEAWMATPRLVLERFKDVKPGDAAWIMSQEFAEKGHKNLRIYYAAVKVNNTPYDAWDIYEVTRDLKTDPDVLQTRYMAYTRKPQEVVRYLRAHESELEKGAYIPVPKAAGTYQNFANSYGSHIDDKGQMHARGKGFNTGAATRIDSEGLKRIFAAKGPQEYSFESWNDVYTNIVDAAPVEGVSAEDLARDPAWPAFAKSAEKQLGTLNRLPDRLSNDKLSVAQREQAILALGESSFAHIRKFQSEESACLARHLADTSLLLALMQAGSKLCDSQFAVGAIFDEGSLSLLGALERTVSEIARARFDLSEEESKKLATVMTLGLDPRAGILPLQQVLEKYPQQLPALTPGFNTVAQDTGDAPGPQNAPAASGIGAAKKLPSPPKAPG